ncbi:MAG: hypothetical protein M0Z35_07195 [Desulfitobacterium hafniense]|nr:hypothetical protein [Desulfitobacterium hafniense]
MNKTSADREHSFISAMSNVLHNTLEIMIHLKNNGFFTAPASTKYHGNYEGGLFDHSLQTMDTLVDLSMRNRLIWIRPESPYIVGMFHDICKIDAYKIEPENPFGWIHKGDLLIKGHGDKSVMILSTIMQLTEEEMLCIRYHMGAFADKEEWNYYTRAVNKYPNVLWSHTADMLASHVAGV